MILWETETLCFTYSSALYKVLPIREQKLRSLWFYSAELKCFHVCHEVAKDRSEESQERIEHAVGSEQQIFNKIMNVK